jgi:hypothetical protein
MATSRARRKRRRYFEKTETTQRRLDRERERAEWLRKKR